MKNIVIYFLKCGSHQNSGTFIVQEVVAQTKIFLSAH
jgi:hypothetical protein